MTRKTFFAFVLVCLLPAFLAAQKIISNYEKSWAKIDSLVNKKGLLQSALDEVNKIYSSAKKEKNEVQVIKALLYRMNLEERRDPDVQIKNIRELEKEIAASIQPYTSILYSIEAEAYWNYLQQHRWQLYNRTATINFNKEDISSWGVDDFHKKITQLYLNSLAQEKLLEQTKLRPFDAIIIKGNVRYLRPTLFDLLAHRALEYFKTNEIDITRASYSFELDNAVVFADKNTFADYHFITADSLSPHFKALLLFQKLLRFHSSDAEPDALLDADIERIVFANEYGVMENKEELYTAALQTITNRYDKKLSARAWYLQAQQLANKAALYNPLQDTTNRYAYLQAKEICERIASPATGDSSEGKVNCENLLQDILRKEIGTKAEKVNVPGKPFRLLVSYRNVFQLYFRVIKIDGSISESLAPLKWTDKYWKKLLQLPAIKTFDQPLPDTKDYQKHAVEIKVDGLLPGEYALLASPDNNFTLEKNPMAVQFLYVSDIAYINNEDDYFVLDRETGQPLQGTDVQVWYRYYDAKQNKYVQRKGEEFNTGKNGFFHISPSKTKRNNNFSFEFTRGDDHLWMDEELGYYELERAEGNDEANISKAAYEKKYLKTFFFTDRSIYRPGQTVYFKGITVTRDFNSRQYKIVSGFKTKTILFDANNQPIDSVEVVSNEFGSYHGTFKLRENQLNGEFKIEDDSTNDEQAFSVEEYKRPKFYVTYDTLEGVYRLNDHIKVTGNARGYAGNEIDGATVKYRVTRQARFPRPWLYWRIGIPSIHDQEITHGEIKTGADGKFSFEFTAIPDKSVNKEFDPVFEYRVSADVTDINGETRSAETVVPVGYKSINLTIDLPEEENLPADSFRWISVRTTNLAGKFESATINVSIYLLRAPDRLIRQRYWEEPDQFVMTRDEYLKYFPSDEYSTETKKDSWEKTDKILEFNDTTSEDKRFGIENAKFKAGWYVIEVLAKDKYGEQVKQLQFVQLYDSQTGSPASPQYNWITYTSTTAEPGEIARTSVGSSANNVFVISQVNKNSVVATQGEINNYSFVSLSNERKSFIIPVTDTDRGGFGHYSAFVKDNRFYVSSSVVNVPWTNKELTISYESWRDKTVPGSEEKWKVKISGYRKDKAAAEILAAMYDASLDQFRLQYWEKPNLYPDFYGENGWDGGNNFAAIESDEKYQNLLFENGFAKKYDFLIFSKSKFAQPQMAEGRVSGIPVTQSNKLRLADSAVSRKKELTGAISSVKYSKQSELFVMAEKLKKPEASEQSIIQPRKKFNETAFFFPDLKTDSAGDAEFSFTMPEALTQWKWMTLAHTKDLALGYGEKSVITQKQLMVQPNAPRYLREGDRIEFSTKIVNLTDSEITGQAELQLIDPLTGQQFDSRFSNRIPNQFFTVAAKQSISLSFPFEVPYQFDQPVTYSMVARAALPGNKGEASDGEESTLPVLSNRILVTEMLPLNMNGNGTKNFKFGKLLHSGESETLTNHALTVEFISNPAWSAVQALPYLMEYPYECSEQTFNRFYANALAAMIINSSPRIKQIFEQWKKTDTTAFLSNLQKDEELKSVLLQETPWVLEAKNENQQKKNIALLFDMIRINGELQSMVEKLKGMQLANGGFAWFPGGADSRYITQYILSGIGHLKKLNALPPSLSKEINEMAQSALTYLDKKIIKDYEDFNLRKIKSPVSSDISEIQIQYLYARSFFGNFPAPANGSAAMEHYRKQAQQFWLSQNKYMQGMIALALYRSGDSKTAKDIINSLKQHAIIDNEMGMYWKNAPAGYYWYQAPVETQSLLIEAFQEITGDNKTTDNLKTWLLKQKQVQNWSTTKATADACYTLLLSGTNWLSEQRPVEIQLGNKIIKEKNESGELGTGYFKKTIQGQLVQPNMGNITVSTFPVSPKTTEPAWGSIYWQYFEDLNKITSSAGGKIPIAISKKIFVEKNTDRGPMLEPVPDNGSFQIGDKIKVRIELRVDRDLEYVHMKDMRASCLEPVNVLSGYRWQNGLGYYESTKDASTNFFFDRLPRGTHVFEYTLFATTAGTFSNGITSIQCMYAPEFSAHNEGIRISVEERN